MTNNTTENISISIKTSLLHRTDRFCSRHELQRSQVVAKALKRFLASELADDPAFWDHIYDKEDI